MKRQFALADLVPVVAQSGDQSQARGVTRSGDLQLRVLAGPTEGDVKVIPIPTEVPSPSWPPSVSSEQRLSQERLGSSVGRNNLHDRKDPSSGADHVSEREVAVSESIWDKTRRAWSSWVGLLVAAFAVALGFFVPLAHISPWSNLTCLAGAAWLVVIFLRKKNDPAQAVQANSLGKPIPLEISIVDLVRAESYVTHNYDLFAIKYFTKLLAALPDYLSRVDDQATLEGRTLLSFTTLTFRGIQQDPPIEPNLGPQAELKVGEGCEQDIAKFAAVQQPASDQRSPLIVPVVRAEKGQLFDKFCVTDSGKRELPTLPQWQVYGLVALVLRNLFEQEASARQGEELAETTAGLTAAESLILLQLVKNSIASILNRDKSQEQIDAKLELLDQLDGRRFSADWKANIRSLCVSLMDTYLIVVEVPHVAGDSIVLRYSNTVPFERYASSPDTALRRKHGLLPNRIDIHHPWALSSDSYHFEMSSYQDTYVYDHHLEKMQGKTPLLQDDFKTPRGRWYVRLYYQEARTLAHLYIRRQGKGAVPGDGREELQMAEASDFKSVVEFREIPPGALGNAVTVALVTSVVIAYFALFRIGIDPASVQSGGHANQGVPALLLTLPAFLAAAVGRGLTTERMLISSLTAFYGLWAIAATAMAAVLLYIVSATNVLLLEVSLAFGPVVLDFNLFWVSLMLASVGELLYLRKKKNEERNYFLKLLEDQALDGDVKATNNTGGN